MSKPDTPSLTVDAIIQKDDEILLIKRLNEPFKDCWALPGGFVDVGETTEAACIREVKEETSLEVGVDYLLGVYSDPDRDPRGHTVSVVYVVKDINCEPLAADDAKDVKYFNPSHLPDLAFDHRKIVEDYIRQKN